GAARRPRDEAEDVPRPEERRSDRDGAHRRADLEGPHGGARGPGARIIALLRPDPTPPLRVTGGGAPGRPGRSAPRARRCAARARRSPRATLRGGPRRGGLALGRRRTSGSRTGARRRRGSAPDRRGGRTGARRLWAGGGASAALRGPGRRAREA